MKRVLIFRTSSDTTMYKLLEEIGDEQIDCLIQSSQARRYSEQYPNINFIDIQSEDFYDLSESVLKKIGVVTYDELYITFSGTVGHNYGNVVEILQYTRFKNAYFYNCNGERTTIPTPNKIKDLLCKWFIWLLQKIYGLYRG